MDQHLYVLGPNGNRTQHAELNGRVVDYVYDDLYRLTQEDVTDATLGNRTTTWTYDAVGNRLTEIDAGRVRHDDHDLRLRSERSPDERDGDGSQPGLLPRIPTTTTAIR